MNQSASGYAVGYFSRVLTSGPSRRRARAADVPAGGLVVAVGPDEFVFAGCGLVVTFETDSPGDPRVGILSAEEGK